MAPAGDMATGNVATGCNALFILKVANNPVFVRFQCNVHSMHKHTYLKLLLYILLILYMTPHFTLTFVYLPHHNHNRFTALFPGPSGWAGTRKELLAFTVQGKINRGRHTDHPAGHHSIQTNQCPPPPSPPFFLQARCPSCLPTNSVKAMKASHSHI